MNLSYVSTRGKRAGTELYPHKNKEGKYIVSPTRFEKDHIYVDSLEEVVGYLKQGLKLRMSDCLGNSPSLIDGDKIVIEE